MSRFREWEVWCRCDGCRDFANVIFWVRHTGGGRYEARLEKSTLAAFDEANTTLLHRPGHCNGRLTLFDPMPGPTTIV